MQKACRAFELCGEAELAQEGAAALPRALRPARQGTAALNPAPLRQVKAKKAAAVTVKKKKAKGKKRADAAEALEAKAAQG